MFLQRNAPDTNYNLQGATCLCCIDALFILTEANPLFSLILSVPVNINQQREGGESVQCEGYRADKSTKVKASVISNAGPKPDVLDHSGSNRAKTMDVAGIREEGHGTSICRRDAVGGWGCSCAGRRRSECICQCAASPVMVRYSSVPSSTDVRGAMLVLLVLIIWAGSAAGLGDGDALNPTDYEDVPATMSIPPVPVLQETPAPPQDTKHFQVAGVEFHRVETPFIIGVWIVCASLAKIGGYT
ncbi:hypothetical protein J6590_097287 [Homalodisca vitripennis]|nr:hypothetical protein J6590_097287 [Homalodisca vitripennis]